MSKASPTITPIRTYSSATRGASDLVAVGSLMYVANGQDGLRIYDIDSGVHPVAQGHISNEGTEGYAASVAISGTYAFIANSKAGLEICNVSDPVNPKRIGRIVNSENFGSATHVVVKNGHAFVANAGDGLRVYDIANPASPKAAGHWDNSGTTGYASKLRLAGDIAFMANVADGVRVIDISNPKLPKDIGHIPTGLGGGAPTEGLDVSGKWLFLAGSYWGLRIYHVENPTLPVFVTEISQPFRDTAVNVTIQGTYAFVSLMEAGFVIYDVHNPANPKLVGTSDAGGSTYNLFVRGNYAYEANFYDGLCINRLLPGLEIAQQTGGVRISWPSLSVGFILQQTGSDLGTWQNVPEEAAIADGTFVVLKDPIGPAGLFRLHLP